MPEVTPLQDPIEFIESSIEAEDYEAAIDVIENLDLDTLPPENEGRVIALAYICYTDVEEFRLAQRTKDTMLKRSLDNPGYGRAAAEELADFGARDESEELFIMLTRFYVNDPRIQYEFAAFLEEEERFEEALDYYETALNLDPEREPHAHVGRAFCLFEAHRGDEAIHALKRYLTIRPRDGEQWAALGAMCAEENRFEEAYDAFQHAETCRYEDDRLYLSWAAAAAERRDRDKLEDCRDKLAQSECQWQTLLADSLLAQLDGETWLAWEAAREAFETALEMEDDEGLEIAAERCVRYAMEFDLAAPLEEFIDLLFEEDLFTTSVLAALRKLEGRHSKEAHDYEVAVEGETNDPHDPEDENGSAGPYNYMRSYRVLAESKQQAEQFVRHFEERCGAQRCIITEVAPTRWTGPADLGVWMRSEPYYFSPGEDDIEI